MQMLVHRLHLTKLLTKKENKKKKVQMLTSFTFGMHPEVLFGEISSGAAFRMQITNQQEFTITLSIERENLRLLVVTVRISRSPEVRPP